MKHQPWSISKADVAHACTFRFHLKYVSKRPEKAVESGDGRVGSGVHYILEKMVNGQSYADAFTHAAMHSSMTYKEILTMKSYESAVMRFLAKLEALKASADVLEIKTELKASVDTDFQPSEYWDANTLIRGIMDLAILVMRGGKKYLLIIDHKSGVIKDIEAYSMQLGSYLAMGRALFPDIEGVQSAIHWLKAEEALNEKVVEWGPMRSVDYIEEVTMPSILKYLQEAEDAGNAPATPTKGWYCNFCGYKDICPAFT